jgi:hypothetical protein
VDVKLGSNALFFICYGEMLFLGWCIALCCICSLFGGGLIIVYSYIV